MGLGIKFSYECGYCGCSAKHDPEYGLPKNWVRLDCSVNKNKDGQVKNLIETRNEFTIFCCEAHLRKWIEKKLLSRVDLYTKPEKEVDFDLESVLVFEGQKYRIVEILEENTQEIVPIHSMYESSPVYFTPGMNEKKIDLTLIGIAG